ncbi:CubicO group peptidase (beta-lactamase class C family) [Aquimarina sp. EL_43]|uniref:serine hydrolase n=1 Tax=unclassified Aquimarina TaxID=2627091 RepID=UPI0018CADA15|nr:MULTISPECIES: serine hydrolase [unclassified Aquimarina]MBG6129477.1 CubicO group peptidase (beta-lactamase class C family) [Aquimarina sp. EL_35]MBG6150542.1 CubicO group peptidase (beta-lactamase class C family) [Aquimarina sp. EL_32]MBG6168150.1 CubicO group peptidase (beta-lactamase class C family) [Aquimarina sp. EL_43]
MIKVITFLIICFVSSLQAQTINDKIEEMMQKHVELDQFSGTVLLAKEGKILYQKAFGDANKSYQIKNNIDTKFNIASMGKMFTGVSIMQLEERGKLNINDPVVKYLKDFPFGNKITIHHLLSHTSGLSNYMRHKVYRANRGKRYVINDIIPFIYEQKLEFDIPGKKFAYSNSGMVVLGAIIEKISGQSYSEFITQNIFIPAKMYNTQMRFWDDVVENRALGYLKSISGKYTNTIYTNSSPQSDGGILSTVKDMLKFDQALYTSLLINENSKKKLFTNVIPKITYGLAFQVENKNNNRVVGHGGGLPGFSSYFSRYLDDKYTIIALSNYDMISRNIVYYIEDILYNKKYQLPKERLRFFIYSNKAKINNFNDLKDIENFVKIHNYSLNHPQRLNLIAYEFMREKNTEFAIKLFKLNVHLFPDEANMYDSLGEAYENNEQFDLALKSYEKAVEVAKKQSHRLLNSFTNTLNRFKEKLQ